MNIRCHVIISGKVQGVFFRSSTKSVAIELDITGWVRNRVDGVVEAVFEGEKENIEQMIDWCRKGPDLARVMDVKVISERYTGEFKSFEVR
jgi:acylphosphatase